MAGAPKNHADEIAQSGAVDLKLDYKAKMKGM